MPKKAKAVPDRASITPTISSKPGGMVSGYELKLRRERLAVRNSSNGSFNSGPTQVVPIILPNENKTVTVHTRVPRVDDTFDVSSDSSDSDSDGDIVESGPNVSPTPIVAKQKNEVRISSTYAFNFI